MRISSLGLAARRSLGFSSIFGDCRCIKIPYSQIGLSKLHQTKFISTTSSNVSPSHQHRINPCDSLLKPPDLTSKYQLYYQTRDILNRLNYNQFDKFQLDIFTWVKARCRDQKFYVDPRSDKLEPNRNDSHESHTPNISLVVGASNTGKTSSYLLALTDVTNDPSKQEFRANRDTYRSKMMLYGNLKGSKMLFPKNMPKINGIPKFDWNGYVVPLAIVLVPFRELGMNIFEFCSKINLRSRLLAGGKGYKKQTGLIGGNVCSVNKNEKDNVDVIIATPEMLHRSLTGEIDDLKIEMRFVKFMFFEEGDLLSEPLYLEKINQILNLVYRNDLNLLYLTRLKTDEVVNNIQQLIGATRTTLELTNIRPNNSSDCNIDVIEKAGQPDDKVTKVFIHTSGGDRLELLIDVLNEIVTQPKLEGGNDLKTVVYCKNTKANKFLKYSLLDRGFNATNLYGDMNYDERSDNLSKFQRDSNILITTGFASRFRLPTQVHRVVLFNFPQTVSEYTDYLSTFSKAPAACQQKLYTFFNNKNLKVLKDIQGVSTSFDLFEYRNLPPKLSKKLYMNQKLVEKKLMSLKLKRKKVKLTARKNVLSPKNKRTMKKYYLREKAVKKVEFLRRRGVLKRGYGLPKMPDKNVEMSDSQEFIKMKRTPDGFLQIIPKRRSRIREFEEVHGYDKESVIIPGAPTYDAEPLELKKHHRNTHF